MKFILEIPPENYSIDFPPSCSALWEMKLNSSKEALMVPSVECLCCCDEIQIQFVSLLCVMSLNVIQSANGLICDKKDEIFSSVHLSDKVQMKTILPLTLFGRMGGNSQDVPGWKHYVRWGKYCCSWKNAFIAETIVGTFVAFASV